MAALSSSSVQYTHQVDCPVGSKDERVIQFHYVNLINPGTAGTVTLVRLPKGKIRINYSKSKFACSDNTATTKISIGYAAHTTPDDAHTSVAADVNGFFDATLISTPLTSYQTFAAPTGETAVTDFNSEGGLVVTCTTTVSSVANNTIIKGFVTFTYLDN